MTLLNAQAALTTLLNLMALPGALMTAIGGYLLFTGSREQQENRKLTGRFLLMFGLILLVIVLILTLYLSLGERPIKPAI